MRVRANDSGQRVAESGRSRLVNALLQSLGTAIIVGGIAALTAAEHGPPATRAGVGILLGILLGGISGWLIARHGARVVERSSSWIIGALSYASFAAAVFVSFMIITEARREVWLILAPGAAALGALFMWVDAARRERVTD